LFRSARLSPADSVVNSWWDFGHWFKVVAGRRVLFDGMTQNTPYAYWMAQVFLSDDETAAARTLKMLDASGLEGVELLVDRLGGVGEAAATETLSPIAATLEGWRYVVRHPVIWMLLVSNVVFTFFSMPFNHLLPGFVKQVLGGGPEMLGVMMSVVSLGALSSTLFIASMRARNRGRMVLLGNAALGLALVAFAFSGSAWFTLPLLLVIGVGQSLRNSLSNVLSQTYVDEAYRGRVMSLVAMQMNAAQLGTFAIGVASEALGARWAFAGMGAALVLMSTAFTLTFGPMRRLP